MGSDKEKGSTASMIFWIVIIAILILLIFATFGTKSDIDLKKRYTITTSINDQQQDTMKAIYYQVVKDAVEKYVIAANGGNKIDMCVYASMVKAAMIQAKDSQGYKDWLKIESHDCNAVGMHVD